MTPQVAEMNMCNMGDMETSLQYLLISSKFYNTSTASNNIGDATESNGYVDIKSGGLSFCKKFSEYLLNEDYEKVLADFFKYLNREHKTFDSHLIDDLLAKGPIERHLEIISVGVSALQMFVQVNWTGKKSFDDSELGTLTNEFSCISKEFRNQVLVESVKGESVESAVENLELLIFAVICLLPKGNFQNAFEDSWSVKWWQLRCLSIHQQVMTEKSDVIYKEALRTVEHLENYFETKTNKDCKLMCPNIGKESMKLYMMYFNLEVSACYATYFDVTNMTKVTLKIAHILIFSHD